MNELTRAILTAKTRMAALSRVRDVDPDRMAAARQDLLCLKLEQEIRRALDPPLPYLPLTQSNRVRLAALLVAPVRAAGEPAVAAGMPGRYPSPTAPGAGSKEPQEASANG